MSEKVVVLPYDPHWPKMFKEESKKIQKALGENCIAIHHIGSTSVPGLSAKPIIDMIPVVHDLSRADSCNNNMQQLGYEVKGEFGFFLRRFFVKENQFHIHVFEKGNPEIDRHIKFRDWMRVHSDDRIAYEQLKLSLADKFSNDRTAYTFAKDKFVANIDNKSGWRGYRIMKAYTDEEWKSIKLIREKYLGIYPVCFMQKLPLTNDDKNTHIIMVKNDRMIGYAHLHFDLKEKSTIVFLYIDKEKKSIGFGAKFLASIEQWLESNKHNIIHVVSVPSMLKFYKKKRYVQCSDSTFYSSGNRNTDVIMLKKSLANKTNNNEGFQSRDVIGLYTQLDSFRIKIWLDGGWGVDALLGRQTRPHEDLDIVVQQKHVAKLRDFLVSKGYSDIEQNDESTWNFVLGDDNSNKIDVHVIVFDEEGNGIYGPAERGVFYPAKSLTGEGVIDNIAVRCLTPEYQVESHTGYEPSESDFQDVSALCKQFNIKNPIKIGE